MGSSLQSSAARRGVRASGEYADVMRAPSASTRSRSRAGRPASAAGSASSRLQLRLRRRAAARAGRRTSASPMPRSQELELVAASGAVAGDCCASARPICCTRLPREGWEFTGIRVRVQVRPAATEPTKTLAKQLDEARCGHAVERWPRRLRRRARWPDALQAPRARMRPATRGVRAIGRRGARRRRRSGCRSSSRIVNLITCQMKRR